MQRTRYLQDIVVWAPAKINLFLEILGKRPDGYHELETLMVALRWFDTLVFQEAASDLTLTCSRPDLTTGPDNLVLKAGVALQKKTGCRLGARIRLIKRIPVQAGLAGGSTDAAATLVGLNELWKLGLPDAELMDIASGLGSDIAFFFQTPAAWCTGRGEVVRPAKIAKPLDLVLIAPPFGMATPAVYARVTVPPIPRDGQAILKALGEGDIEALGRALFNRLQPAAESLDPRLGEIARTLAECQGAGALMSGSGSSWFILCRSGREAEMIADRLRSRGPLLLGSVHVVRSYPS